MYALFFDQKCTANLPFLSKLLSNSIDCPTLLTQIYFEVPPCDTRCSTPFFVPFFSTNYLLNFPLYYRMNLANEDPTLINYSLTLGLTTGSIIIIVKS